jgi:hypothetical protein
VCPLYLGGDRGYSIAGGDWHRTHAAAEHHQSDGARRGTQLDAAGRLPPRGGERTHLRRVHFRTSTEVGTDMGKKLGEFVAAKYLQPLK